MALPSQIHKSWYPILEECFNLKEIIHLNKEVLPKSPYSPSKDFIFRVFEIPIDKVKVVILGQDPYPKRRDAIGLAFATSNENSKPKSLKVIENELGTELQNDLSHWVEQGVLLLNTALTCEIGNPGSHLEYWKKFTTKVIQGLSSYNKKIIWLLWGNVAKSFSEFIDVESPVLEAGHPASESYGSGKFLGCNHFTLTNIILQHNKINW